MPSHGCRCGWAAQSFRCFAEHGKSSPVMASAPDEVQPDELLLALSLQLQQQATFESVILTLSVAHGQKQASTDPFDLMKCILRRVLSLLSAHLPRISCLTCQSMGRNKLTHPWQPTRLNGWNSVLHHQQDTLSRQVVMYLLTIGPRKPRT